MTTAENVVLCPGCGERLTTKSKQNTSGDWIGRRECKAGDYVEVWVNVSAPAAKNDDPRTADHRISTALAESRIAPLPPLKTVL